MSGSAEEASLAVSDRGFAHCPPVECTYGTTVRLYESSSIEPAIWLNLAPGPYLPPDDDGSVAAHLSLEGARQLRDQLVTLIERAEERSRG